MTRNFGIGTLGRSNGGIERSQHRGMRRSVVHVLHVAEAVLPRHLLQNPVRVLERPQARAVSCYRPERANRAVSPVSRLIEPLRPSGLILDQRTRHAQQLGWPRLGPSHRATAKQNREAAHPSGHAPPCEPPSLASENRSPRRWHGRCWQAKLSTIERHPILLSLSPDGLRSEGPPHPRFRSPRRKVGPLAAVALLWSALFPSSPFAGIRRQDSCLSHAGVRRSVPRSAESPRRASRRVAVIGRRAQNVKEIPSAARRSGAPSAAELRRQLAKILGRHVEFPAVRSLGRPARPVLCGSRHERGAKPAPGRPRKVARMRRHHH